jgi:F-type H+-transporting ATPase subunit d
MAVGVRTSLLRLFINHQTPLTSLSQRSAAAKIDWTRITSSLGLKGSTSTSLMAFKKRNDDARRKINLLSQAPTTVDLAHYRTVLNNTAIVDEIEGYMKSFKPQTYDVGRQVKAIEAFETQAVKSAEETKGRVDEELRSLEKTLKNIEEARPFEDLTVVRLEHVARQGCECMLTPDMMIYRMRLLLRDRISMSAHRSSYRKEDGKCRATRYATLLVHFEQCTLI